MTDQQTSRTNITEALRLPWHRETVGHADIWQIAAKNAADLAVPLGEGLPPNTDATWIVNADNKIVAFVGNGPRQTHNADAIIAAVEALAAEPRSDAVTAPDEPGEHNEGTCDLCTGWHDAEEAAFMNGRREARAASASAPPLPDAKAITVLARAACGTREPLPVDYDDAWNVLRHLRENGVTLYVAEAPEQGRGDE